MSHSHRLTITWLLLVVATSLAFFGESALASHGRAFVLGMAWFKLDRIACTFMELDEGPALVRRLVRAGLLLLALLFFLILP